jgi:hypothetical protein
MTAKLSLSLLAGFFGFALSAFAQIDGAAFASDLRAKYGPPLARETFAVRPEVEMVVDYADNGHVCKLQLPPVAPGPDSGLITTQAIDDILTELLPPNIRGKELNRTYFAMGLASGSVVVYENVTIHKMLQGEQPTGVTVTFKNEECHKQAISAVFNN